MSIHAGTVGVASVRGVGCGSRSSIGEKLGRARPRASLTLSMSTSLMTFLSSLTPEPSHSCQHPGHETVYRASNRFSNEYLTQSFVVPTKRQLVFFPSYENRMRLTSAYQKTNLAGVVWVTSSRLSSIKPSPAARRPGL